MLEIAGLHSGYGSVPVLDDINLAVGKGEILLVVGENGAGSPRCFAPSVDLSNPIGVQSSSVAKKLVA